MQKIQIHFARRLGEHGEFKYLLHGGFKYVYHGGEENTENLNTIHMEEIKYISHGDFKCVSQVVEENTENKLCYNGM